MIKVELLKDGENSVLFFEATKPEQEQDILDQILKSLCSGYPIRGAYALGAPNLTLKIEVNKK